eukprot:1561061-Amphidinium_carterae.1
MPCFVGFGVPALDLLPVRPSIPPALPAPLAPALRPSPEGVPPAEQTLWTFTCYTNFTKTSSKHLSKPNVSLLQPKPLTKLKKPATP